MTTLDNVLIARRLGLDTQQEPMVFVRTGCRVCRSEGFESRARVEVRYDGRSIIATLYQVTSELVAESEAGLSESAWRHLGIVQEGTAISFHHPRPLLSLSAVRAKAYGHRLDEAQMRTIIGDVVQGLYSDIHISSFVTACTASGLDFEEMVSLTRAMVDTGDRIRWPAALVVDKHSVGGLPGNRTTPIVVAIVAANGLCMPKTSSRAITSPAGTADTMEVLAPVDLDVAAMRRVVELEGGCIAWGGAVRLSPADDILIRVERALDLDSEGQLVASVLSKKIAAGANCVVLDIPVGPTAKVRDEGAARSLALTLQSVAAQFGVRCHALISDGSQPVGRGIGPALEARDVMRVLEGRADAPADLRERALRLAGALLEIGGVAASGAGNALAVRTLDEGTALKKFLAICAAQGGLRAIPEAPFKQAVAATRTGTVRVVDNRRLALVAKLAGAPDAKAAGVELMVRLGAAVQVGQPLYVVHAETVGELAYASEFANQNPGIIEMELVA